MPSAERRARGPAAPAAFVVLALLGAACGRDEAAPPSSEALADAKPPWDVAQPEPEPRAGMVWIAPGVLVAGTPPDRIPRVADEEMAGAQVVMHGYYVDVFPYPNEAGAIPTTNVAHAQARALCEEQGKRLCSELELERACKGPANTTYEYGDVYKPSACQTGTGKALVPSGFNAPCQSAFGVRDLHGGVWSWTSSPWRRDPSKEGLFAVRGGNGLAGELVGRCANGRGMRAEARREDVGVRCCAGEPNDFEVVLTVTRGKALEWQAPDDRIAPQLEQLVPEEIQSALRERKPERRFEVKRMWFWRPLGNEELVVGGGCAETGEHDRCGVVIARVRFDVATPLAFVSSEWWQPTLGETDTARELFLYGGDVGGAFRRKVSYEWGRIATGDKMRKRKHKGRAQPEY